MAPGDGDPDGRRLRDFSIDWFTSRLCQWTVMFERHPLPAEADVLEIGGWDGMFILSALNRLPVDSPGRSGEHEHNGNIRVGQQVERDHVRKTDHR